MVKYQYDNSGALAMVTDSESGITSICYYDLIDWLCKYKEAGTDYSMTLEYGFNEMNQVSYVFETINGNRRSIGITYDDDDRVSSYRKGSVTEAYTYDAYSWVTNKVTTVAVDEETETRLTEALTYRTNSSGNATNQVNTLAITSNGDHSTYFTYLRRCMWKELRDSTSTSKGGWLNDKEKAFFDLRCGAYYSFGDLCL